MQNFYQEYEGPEPIPSCPIIRVAKVHSTLDLALLEVRVPDARPTLILDTATTTAPALVAAIGYPFKDERSPLFVEAIYQDKYGVKRAAVGELIGGSGQFMYHDCSTLGGWAGR